MEERLDNIDKILTVGNGQPAITVQLAKITVQVDDISETIKGLPGKILLGLSIILAIVSILAFLGPSIKKAIGLAQSAHPMVFADTTDVSTIPTLRGN